MITYDDRILLLTNPINGPVMCFHRLQENIQVKIQGTVIQAKFIHY